MSNILLSTSNLLNTLDKSSLIRKLTIYKQKLEHNDYIISLVNIYNKETDINKKLTIKKELYQNKDYQNYMKYYNELSLIVLRINQKYHEYTNTKE